MKAKGWDGDPIDVVRMPDGNLTTIDNTRVLAARYAEIDVQANVHAFDEVLPQDLDLIERLTTPKGVPQTWGMRNGRGPTTKANAGDRNIEAHHRKQKSTANGGILDDLEEYTHRMGGNHKRHTEPSELTPKQRAKEIREYWKKRGAEYILPGEGI